ncbi:hypothetical protein Q9299_06435 [Gemmobacter fulvus]|uniref:hypothetical protein n=1 Tax=Gemmobacter fulvus TaxID=2840474 RepID=UPI002796DD2F|nr:hypothetical protein [Gemmobacter fulvus]MDQ1847920.1 hypothetical protein [Gemmobacter fulvus]
MDFARIIQQIANIFIRKAVNTAVNKGVDYAARRGKTPAAMTQKDKDQAASARDMVKKARKAAQVTRRLGR